MVFFTLDGRTTKIEVIYSHIVSQMISCISKILNPAFKLNNACIIGASDSFLVRGFQISVNSVQIAHSHDFNGNPHRKLATVFFNMMLYERQFLIIVYFLKKI